VKGFVDNDIIHKLAAFDLLYEALEVLGIKRKNVHVLHTAKFKFYAAKITDHPKGVRRYGEDVFQRIRDFLAIATEVEETHPGDVAVFNDVFGIDPGEAILYSCAARTPNSLLLTGDKRGLDALVKTPACVPIVGLLERRVISLEHMIVRLLDAHGFDAITPKIVRAMECDTTMRVAFGSGAKAKEHDVRAALDSYIARMPPQLMIQ